MPRGNLKGPHLLLFACGALLSETLEPMAEVHLARTGRIWPAFVPRTISPLLWILGAFAGFYLYLFFAGTFSSPASGTPFVGTSSPKNFSEGRKELDPGRGMM